MKQFSVDDILDDIKRKKGEQAPKASASSADIDRLLAEIRGEKPAVVKEEPKPMPVVTRTVHEESVHAEAPAPKKAEASAPPKEKFTVKIDFSKTLDDPQPLPKKEEKEAPQLSTVDLLAESLAADVGVERPAKAEEPAPIVRIIPDEPEEAPKQEEPSEGFEPISSAEPELVKEEPAPIVRIIPDEPELPAAEEPEVEEPTRYIDKIEPPEERVLPDPRAFVRPAEEKQEEEPDEDEDDDFLEYRSPEDEREVYTEILSNRRGLIAKIVLLACFGGAALLIALLQETLPQSLPAFLQKAEQPLISLIIQFVLQIGCLLSCSTMIAEGLIAGLRLRATCDTLPALAALGGLIHTVVCFFDISVLSNPAVHFYTPVIAGVLLCCCGAKLMMVNRMILNFRVVASPYEKYVTTIVEDENTALELTRGSVADYPTVAVRRKADFVTEFMAYSTDEDVSDNYARTLAPAGLGFALLLGIVSGIMTGNLAVAFTTAVATLCVFAPFSYLLSVQLPMSRAAKRYSRDGGVILSMSEADEFSEVNAVAVTAHDLFPGNSVKLFGIKTFAGQRIDEALMDAASVIRESGSVLTNVFAQIIGGDEKLLRPVDSLVYEDGMGISAWVDNKRVLIGSRELMVNHGISVPSRDYEKRYLNEGHELIYLSTSGELTAVFLAKFFAAPEVKAAIHRLSDNGIHLTVKSVDAVITRQKMAEIFDEDPSFFKILPSRLHAAYDEQTAPRAKASSSVLSNGAFQSFAGALIGAKRLKSSILLGCILQFAAIGLGLLLLIILTLISGMSEMKALSLFIYQMIWLVLSFLLPRLKNV